MLKQIKSNDRIIINEISVYDDANQELTKCVFLSDNEAEKYVEDKELEGYRCVRARQWLSGNELASYVLKSISEERGY